MVKIRQVMMLALLSVSASTWAAETLGVLVVSPSPGPTPELVEITAQLRNGFAERTPGVLAPQQLRERISARGTQTSLAELDRTYERAHATYLKGDYERSVQLLRSLIEPLDQLPDSAQANNQWTRAMLRLAKAEAELGHFGEARIVLDRLLRADPAFKVDPSFYSAKFVKDVEEARARIKNAPTQKLTVTSLVGGVRVSVDGREVGSAPVTVTLPRGRHKVSGARGAERSLPVHVELDDDESLVVLDFASLDSLRPDAGPGLVIAQGARDLHVLAASALLGLDEVVTVSQIEERGVSYVVGSAYDVHRGALRREGRVRLEDRSMPLGGTAALAGFLTGQPNKSELIEITQSNVAANAPDLRTLPPGRDFSFQRESLTAHKSKTLGWVAFGTGVGTVALGGVTIWQAVSSSNSYAEAEKLRANGSPFDPARYNAYRADGDSAMNRAIVAGIGTGVCAVATGVLGYLAYQQTGEIGPFRF